MGGQTAGYRWLPGMVEVVYLGLDYPPGHAVTLVAKVPTGDHVDYVHGRYSLAS